MKPTQLSVYLIADEALCRRRGLMATIDAAVEGGATIVQVRAPELTGKQLYDEVRAIVRHLAKTNVPVIVNDRVDVAVAAGAQGVHVGQSDLPPAAVRAVAGGEMILGLSARTPAHLADLAQLPPGTVDYIGTGPAFATTTKPDTPPPVGPRGIRKIVATSPLPVVGIGGIDLDNAAQIYDTGVAGVAVASAICSAGNPMSAARALRLVADRRTAAPR